MKRVLFAVILAFMFSGCLGSMAGSVTFEKDGHIYNISYMWDNIKKELKTSLITNGVEYSCDVIKDNNFTSNIVLTTDFDISDLSAGMSITYKGIKYNCTVNP